MDKNLFLATFYFTLSTLLTWWFVILCPLYVDLPQMLLSTGIAGGKWAIQLILGIVLLKDKAIPFIRAIGAVCLLGSCVLLLYIFAAVFHLSDSPTLFFASLIIAVLSMIVMYYMKVRALGLSLKWWYVWLVCLAIAITLQLTVVFDYIHF